MNVLLVRTNHRKPPHHLLACLQTPLPQPIHHLLPIPNNPLPAPGMRTKHLCPRPNVDQRRLPRIVGAETPLLVRRDGSLGEGE